MKSIVCMAGSGKRFKGSGYGPYKPLIEVKNKTILKWTIESLPSLKSKDILSL